MQNNDRLKKQVTKIQANFRGHMIRKRLTQLRSLVENGTDGGTFDSTIDPNILLRQQEVKVRSF